MYKKMRAITCVMIISLVICTLYNTYCDVTLGKHTPGTSLIGNDSKEWILEEFGDCKNFDCLLNEMAEFSIDNFNYYVFPELIQHFNFDEFLSNGYTGCCYDFSIWAKTVVLTWAEHNDVTVQAYVLDVKSEVYEDFCHSYNHFTVNGVHYYADFTFLLNIEKHNKTINDYIFKTNCSYRDVAEDFDYIIFNIH